MVEFALVLIPLLLLVVGMLQFGIMLNAKIDEIHLSSSGARYAAVNQNPGGAGQSLQDYIKSRADTADLRTNATVCVEYPIGADSGTSREPGDPVKVTMSYVYNLLPFLGDRLGFASISIAGDATMRLETAPDIAAGCST